MTVLCSIGNLMGLEFVLKSSDGDSDCKWSICTRRVVGHVVIAAMCLGATTCLWAFAWFCKDVATFCPRGKGYVSLQLPSTCRANCNSYSCDRRLYAMIGLGCTGIIFYSIGIAAVYSFWVRSLDAASGVPEVVAFDIDLLL